MAVSFTIGSKYEVDANGGLARVATLSSTTAIALYSSAASGIEARFLTRSGTSLSGGTVLTIDANQADSITICKLSGTSAVIGYAYGATHRTRVLTVSGTTLTANAITNMTDTGVDYLSCQFLDINKIIYIYTDSSGNGKARALTVSGITITENASYTWFPFFGSSTPALNAVEVTNTTTALVGYAFDPGSPSSTFYDLLDITGTTITSLDTLGNVGSFAIDLTATLDLGVSDSDPNFVYFSYVINSNKDIRYGLIDATGGALAVDYANGNIAGTFNCASLTAMYLDSGATAPYDVVLFIQNDSSGNNLYIYAEDQWSGDNASDSTVTTTASTGSIHVRKFDDDYAIVVFNESTESLVISFAAISLALAPMTKPASINADGTFIYLALLDGGTPILTKIATDLLSDGTTVFNPGAGDNIGVECGRFNSDVIWVAGQFDGTNVVEKSEDGGSSFVVKDDATIGGVRSFVMGPDNDNRLLIFDEDNGDILETRDGGESWTTVNSAVTPEINAIARLGRNVEESVFGNDGGGSDSISYSVNSGDDLEDYQTGVYPATNATKVIVN